MGNDWEAFMAAEPVSADRFYGMESHERLAAFTVTAEASMAQLGRVRDILAENLERGGTFEEFRKAVRDGEYGAIGELPSYRLHNIYRTNNMMALGRGRYLEQKETAETFPYLIYDAIVDQRTRPNHLALNGLIVAFGSEEADRIYPPNGFQCRCEMRGLMRDEAEALGIPTKEAAKALIDANPPDPGWEGNPFGGEAPPPGDVTGPDPEELEKQLEAAWGKLGVVGDGEWMEGAAQASKEAEEAAKAKATLPESMAAPAAKAAAGVRKVVVGRNDGSPAPMTAEERKVKGRVARDVTRGLVNAGLLPPGAGRREVAAYLKDLLGRLYLDAGLTDLDRAFSEFKGDMTVNKILNGEIWFLEDKVYSARTMRFLGEWEQMLLAFHSRHGDELSLAVLKGTQDGPGLKENQAEYLKAQTVIAEALNRGVEREEVPLYRGVHDARGYRDATGSRTLFDVLSGLEGDPVGKVIEFGLTSSFSEDERVAENFALERDDSVIFHVVTGKGIPVISISSFAPESEHLLANGTRGKITRVSRRPNGVWEVDLELTEEELAHFRFAAAP
jgi:SPP1 gp7 family putative phage head morphogenesis protein